MHVIWMESWQAKKDGKRLCPIILFRLHKCAHLRVWVSAYLLTAKAQIVYIDVLKGLGEQKVFAERKGIESRSKELQFAALRCVQNK